MSESSASIRSLLERPPSRPMQNPAPGDAGETEEGYQALAGGRIGNRPQWTLVFQRASGVLRAFPYAQFDGLRADDPELAFVVVFAGVEIEVSGRNLGRLVRAVCDHRAASIVEATRAQGLQLDAVEPIVSAIRIRDPSPRPRPI